MENSLSALRSPDAAVSVSAANAVVWGRAAVDRSSAQSSAIPFFINQSTPIVVSQRRLFVLSLYHMGWKESRKREYFFGKCRAPKSQKLPAGGRRELLGMGRRVRCG